MSCLDLDTAAAYLAGELDQADANRWATHVSECAACRRLTSDVSTLIDDVRQDLLALDDALGDTPPPPVDRFLERAHRRRASVLRPVLTPEPSNADRQTADVGEQPVPRARYMGRRIVGIAVAVIAAVWLGADSASAAAARMRAVLLRMAAYSQSVVRRTPRTSEPRQLAASRLPMYQLSVVPAVRPMVMVTPFEHAPVPIAATSAPTLDRPELAAWHELHVLGLLLGQEATVRHSDHALVVSLSIASDTRRAAVEAVFRRLREADRPIVQASAISEKPRLIVMHDSQLFERLQQHFGASPEPTVVAEEYARSILTTGAALRDRAGSLRSFVDAFPAGRLRALDFDAAAQWRRIVRDHVMEIGSAAGAMRRYLSTTPVAESVEPLTAIGTLSEVEPALGEYLALSDRVSAALGRAAAPGRTSDAYDTLVSELDRLAREAERFTGPWDLSR